MAQNRDTKNRPASRFLPHNLASIRGGLQSRGDNDNEIEDAPIDLYYSSRLPATTVDSSTMATTPTATSILLEPVLPEEAAQRLKERLEDPARAGTKLLAAIKNSGSRKKWQPGLYFSRVNLLIPSALDG
ncbi:hypothetical protein ColLi_09261 [Colletotrichum liriopes]|uniref:Uncharacterized protein n=1 Tax=Colletotrichum liriopes TaxID=708192 RepID=A0AA37GUN2_9PEZI|nr:hypothetical protein ColLi_09261 [Colletotrichum liriopes]